LGYGGDEGVIGVMKSHDGTPFTLNQLNDVSFLIRNFYIVDSATRITDELFDAKVLLEKDMTIKTSNDKPQILIYHTHSQEAYLDSRKQEPEDSVVGIGSLLAEILTEKYGYNVIHDKSVYDLVDGKLDRNKAYTYAREGVLKILEENPSIEVVIDLHRDGAEKRSTVIEGQETAQIMLLNGLSRNQNGPITRLDNPNLQDNLSFSLQLQLKGLKMYPGLFYKNYLQDYRYNLDVRPKSLLVELGTHKNTLRSAKKAMEPFAEILDAVLKGQ
jgi:stage II sporulation protein P